MNLKQDILAALKTATEPMDRTAIAQLCLSGTDKQVADQLYLLKKDGAIIGDKQRGGSFRYRMPNEEELKDAQEAPWVSPIRRMAEEISDEPKKLPPREVIERLIAEKPIINVWPGPTLAERLVAANEMKSQPEIAVSETVEEAYVKPTNYTVEGHISTPREYEEAMKRNEEESMAETISDEVSRFRVGVFSDERMVLESPDEDFFYLDKAEFAVLVEFARTVGWLPT